VERLTAALASRNAHKAQELETLLPGWTIEPLATDAYPPEDGATYYENARGKARFGSSVARPGLWAIGEDSGIEVAALGGRPGIHSARFGGDDPVGRLLGALGEAADRRARYVSEIVLLAPDGRELRGTGILAGRIAEAPTGSEGFGYDPIFIPDGEQRTVADLGNAWKAQNSHRARAARALLAALGAGA
jgi:XTP/dITP diphosphohydrolase